MTTYQWIAVTGIIITLIGGTLLTSLLTAMILWFKTKGLVDLKLSNQGERLGKVEKMQENVINLGDCNRCKEESKRMADLLIGQNNQDHASINNSISKLYARTDEVGQCVTMISTKFDTIERYISNGKK